MFKHILVPVDGSPASQVSLRSALDMAAGYGASITAVHVLPDDHAFSHRPAAQQREKTPSDSTAQGQALLAAVSEAARARQVPCQTVLARGDRPHRKILETAHARGCDLIAMACHGQLGLKGVLLGSQTQKVLVHSPVPVLVFRAE
jgi:nucleotide-binding universal stress UspA family protein